jgi:hypothetical protein
MMQDVHDEPLFAERVSGLDIAKAEAEVTIRVPATPLPGAGSRRPGPTAPPGGSWIRWLVCWGVTKIGMEATGDYVRREGA